MKTQLEQIAAQATALGILPEHVSAAASPPRPWPVILLTALGGWLAAIPLLLALYELLGNLLMKGAGPYVAGFTALATAIVALRQPRLPLFVEQLAIPFLMAGIGAIGLGLSEHREHGLSFALLSLLAISVAIMTPRDWIRTLLGAAAAALAMTAIIAQNSWNSSAGALGAYAIATVWAVTQAVRSTSPSGDQAVRRAVALDAIASGWVVAALCGLAWVAGTTFLVGAAFSGPGAGNSGLWIAHLGTWRAISALVAVAAGACIARMWPAMRQPWALAAVTVAVGLSWLMPALGAALLILALCAGARRWVIASLAALCAAWIVGAFYYQLDITLESKAMLMIVAGAILGTMAWLSLRQGQATPSPLMPHGWRGGIGIAVSAAAVLVVANAGIWEKEQIIAHGTPVYMELQPVDPRSLMQGDYMALRFEVPPQLVRQRQRNPARNLIAVGQIDQRSVLTITRLDDGKPLAPNERRIAIKPRWDFAEVVTNAWYFREGEGARFASAKYGEFRLTEDGRALLVGLRGPNLEPL